MNLDIVNKHLSILNGYNQLSYALFSARITEALKDHRVAWKIEICYLIRMT